ncbi:MAG: dsDNA nuclease domain-containing protein [Sulfurimonas sp.]|nr:dsDNA nuclease domain-containing protein [Sulfurimonas sp.]
MAKKKYSNSGVDGAGGYEFQKHCALYIFLEQYNDIKNSKYFICLEHHDDFLFCYLSEEDFIKSVDTYQAKKSSKKWTITNKEFEEIIMKMLQIGLDLKEETVLKTDTYFHKLHFVSNREIALAKDIINERNKIIKYLELSEKPKNTIENFVEEMHKSELKSLLFKYIPLSTDINEQKNQLVGKFVEIFDTKILYPKAGVETLLSLFRKIELTFNQDNIVSLLDKSKRVESKQINEALNIITTKQKAFDEWKSKKDVYAPILKISVKEYNHFEMEFANAFDYFKDLEAVEHQKIFNFVTIIDLSDCYSPEDGLKKISTEFSRNHNTQFDDITTKASLLASYIQVREGTK